MSVTRALWCAVFVLVVSASTASAQSGGGRPSTREGFWFSGGLGVGSLGCEDCDERETGLGLDLSLGGTLGDRLLIGGALTGWTKEEDGISLTVTSLEGRLRFYPIAESGFFLKGGVGIGSVRTAVDDLGDETESGVGLTLGLGWDLRVGRNVSLTPYWTVTAVSAGDADPNFGQLGIAVTIH